MTTLDECFLKHGTDKASSHHNYAPTYETLLGHLRDEPITFLEIGVQFGNSVRAWLDYFSQAKIVGVDSVSAHSIADSRFSFFVGDQSDPVFLSRVTQAHPVLDVVVDDACHRADASKASLDALWPRVAPGGVYVIEDVFTWWDNAFRSSLDGATWLGDLCGAPSWHGKEYHGKPQAMPYQLTEIEKTIDYVRASRGLVVIGKRR